MALVPTSSAETIVGSTIELVNDSGSFTWTSQNFPALRAGDTLKINVVNSTIERYNLVYTMNTYSINELYSEVFPSGTFVIGNYGSMRYVDYLSNKYCVDSRTGNSLLTPVLINKDLYQIIPGTAINIDDKKIIVLDTSNKVALIRYGTIKSVVSEGQAAVLEEDRGYPTIIAYFKKFDNQYVEIQGIVQMLSTSYSIPLEYGKLRSEPPIMKNYDNIAISEGITDITNELKLIRTSNKIYPSANIIKKDMNIQFKPQSTPTPTPIPTTQTSTPTPTVTNTPTSTPTLTSTPTPTVTPSITPTITPTSSPTVTATVTPTQTTPQITTPAPTATSQLEQEVKELKERLNKTEEKQSQQESRISWLESSINSILDWLKSIF